MTEKAQQIFVEAEKRLYEWLKDKPTGSFSVTIPVNQGGVRGKPEYVIREKEKG